MVSPDSPISSPPPTRVVPDMKPRTAGSPREFQLRRLAIELGQRGRRDERAVTILGCVSEVCGFPLARLRGILHGAAAARGHL